MGMFTSNPQVGCWKVAGIQLHCPHCGGWEFERKEALLNKPLSSAMGVDFLDPLAQALVCTNCGRIELFYDQSQLEFLE